LQLFTDDILFLYTDGIIEAENKEHKPLTEMTIKKLLSESQDLSASDIAAHIHNYINDHKLKTIETDDDMTALVLKIKDKP